MEFIKVSVWAQIWGIPPKIRTKQMGKISSKIGTVLEVKLHSYHKIIIIVKEKAIIVVQKPLKPRLHIGNKKESINCVSKEFLCFFKQYHWPH